MWKEATVPYFGVLIETYMKRVRKDTVGSVRFAGERLYFISFLPDLLIKPN